MIFVQALEEGALTMAGQRFLLQALEEGRWRTDHKVSIDVDPGLIVSFADSADRDHFLRFEKHKPPRARVPVVQAGDVLIFAAEDDVKALEEQSILRRLTAEEIDSVMQQLGENRIPSIPLPGAGPEQGGDEGEPEVTKAKPAGRGKKKGG